MIPLAPRYDPLILELAAALDDPTESMAETCRRVGGVAEASGLIRPSYAHLRRFIVDKRREDEAAKARREELLRIAAELYFDATRGYRTDVYKLVGRLQEAGR